MITAATDPSIRRGAHPRWGKKASAMIDVRPFASFGRFDNDWLNARYHFSFANYYNPARTGFGSLLVWNDDVIAPHTGFPPHGHRDMEIITFVRSGAVTHEDTLGNVGRTEAGDVQVMTAGRGIRHSEYNSDDEPIRVYQIWIEPDRPALEPRWETRHFSRQARAGALMPLASGRAGHDNALFIHQDAALLAAWLRPGEAVAHPMEPGRSAYLVAVNGAVTVNGVRLGERDGAAISDETALTIKATDDTDILLLDLP